MHNLDSDQTAFLAELQQYASHWRQRRRRLRLGGISVTVVAGFAVVSMIVFSSISSPLAYAVTDAPQGGTLITLKSLRDADGLTAELAKRGITATVTFGGTDTGIRDVKAYTPEEVAAGKAGETPPPVSSGDAEFLPGKESPKSCLALDAQPGISVEIINGTTVIDVPDGALPAGEKLMITTSGDDHTQAVLEVARSTSEGLCKAGSIFVDADLFVQRGD